MGLDGFDESIGGRWKLLRNDQFDKYLELMGIGYLKRKLACAFTTIMQLKRLEEDRIQIITDGPKHSDQTVILNDYVVEVDPFDNEIKVKVTWDPETKTLTTDATPTNPAKGKKVIVERKIEPNGELLMQVTLPNDNFVCKRFFMRQDTK